MKLSLIIGLLGITCGVTSSFGQGSVFLDNYNTDGPVVTYGSGGIPANGVSGASGAVGTGLQAGWTLGFYFVVGNATINSDPTGGADPTSLGGGLTLATGSGSTAAFFTSSFGTPGEVLAGSGFAVPGTAIAGGDTITLMAVAYNGASYVSSTARAHSAAFTMVTSANNSASPNKIGSFMPGFAIVVPEPSITALAGLSGAAFVFLRRRK